MFFFFFFFFSSRRRHTRWTGDWSSDVCSSDLNGRRDDLRRRPVVDQRQDLDRAAHSLDQRGLRQRLAAVVAALREDVGRSEERRVGKECRWRGWAKK